MKYSDKEEMFINNMNLVYHVLHKHYNYLLHDEDIVQEGMIGLWKACLHYDPSKSEFSTFACTCILNSIRYELRRRSKYYNIKFISLDHPVDDDKEIDLEQLLPSKSDELADAEYREAFKEVFESFNERDQKIIHLLIQGCRQVAIADQFGLSQTQISKIKNKLKSKIKQFDTAK